MSTYLDTLYVPIIRARTCNRLGSLKNDSARLHRLADLISWNHFLDSLKGYKFRLRYGDQKENNLEIEGTQTDTRLPQIPLAGIFLRREDILIVFFLVCYLWCAGLPAAGENGAREPGVSLYQPEN